MKKVFDSAQKPLWILFQNVDSDGDPFNAMFKNGDDLRQDMLTLQLISIMDQLWQEEGLNLQMNPYACLATGDMVGMLEMVMHASTLWKIQGLCRAKEGCFLPLRFASLLLFGRCLGLGADSGAL